MARVVVGVSDPSYVNDSFVREEDPTGPYRQSYRMATQDNNLMQSRYSIASVHQIDPKLIRQSPSNDQITANNNSYLSSSIVGSSTYSSSQPNVKYSTNTSIKSKSGSNNFLNQKLKFLNTKTKRIAFIALFSLATLILLGALIVIIVFGISIIAFII